MHPQAQNCAFICSTSGGLLSAYWVYAAHECMDKELKNAWKSNRTFAARRWITDDASHRAISPT
ncbi:hypothetical protein HMPREF9096_00026 [Haemophilus sp. oral taxon 851 str. F0397]|nr:hypothetical protein HMPREF9096_00026 [Haemophilus sp. oral taxon 851 str. F0397]